VSGPVYNAAEHRHQTRDAYDRLADVWSRTTDDGPFNGGLERPALRSLVPGPLAGKRVSDAGCGSGAQCAWLLDQGADVVGIDLSPRMVSEAARRCAGRGGSSWLTSPSRYGSSRNHSTASPARKRCTT